MCTQLKKKVSGKGNCLEPAPPGGSTAGPQTAAAAGPGAASTASPCAHPHREWWLQCHQKQLHPGPARVFHRPPPRKATIQPTPAAPDPPPLPGGSAQPPRPHLPKRWARQVEAVSEGSPRSEAATGMLSCKRSTAERRA